MPDPASGVALELCDRQDRNPFDPYGGRTVSDHAARASTVTDTRGALGRGGGQRSRRVGGSVSVRAPRGDGHPRAGQHHPSQDAGTKLHDLDATLDDLGGWRQVQRVPVLAGKAAGRTSRDVPRTRIWASCRRADNG